MDAGAFPIRAQTSSSVSVWRLGGICSADCQSAVSQDAILQDRALAGTLEHRQSPADLQSAIRQISNLRYAKQVPSSARYGRIRYRAELEFRAPDGRGQCRPNRLR